MQKKVVEGTTENLNMLKNKVDYIGFELGEAPDFLKEFEPLNYKVPKIYDETTYRIYRYVPIEEIEILITPSNRLDSLEKRYKEASPLFTYMEAKTDENIEKYARFLKMINQTRIEDIEEIEKWQEAMKEQVPYEVKFEGNFKWQVYYSDYAKKYFMLASAEEMDNSPLFYLLKKKIQQNKNKKSKECVFIPVCNEEYSEQILKKSDIADVENYLWFFTKNWPSIYEVTNIEGETSLQIVGETPVYDKVTSKFNLKYTDKKEAIKEYKLIKNIKNAGHIIFCPAKFRHGEKYMGSKEKALTAAIILAGGKGSRMQSEIPKQYMKINGRPVIYYALEAFSESSVDKIVLVTGNACIDGMDEKTYCIERIIKPYKFEKVIIVTEGGKERYNSVYNGLEALKKQGKVPDYVLIHDGARACITTDLIEKCICEAEKYKACVAAVPVKDTIKISDENGYAVNTPDRNTLWQIQTPQSFEYELIMDAYEKMIKDSARGNITDDAMVVEKYTSVRVKLTQSSYKNIKITTPDDIIIAESFIKK